MTSLSTTVNKAVVAVLGGLATICSTVFQIDLGVGEDVTAILATVITAALVYAVPNKEKTRV